MERRMPELVDRYRDQLFTGLLGLLGRVPTDWFRIEVNLQRSIITMRVKTGVIIVAAAGAYAIQQSAQRRDAGSSPATAEVRHGTGAIPDKEDTVHRTLPEKSRDYSSASPAERGGRAPDDEAAGGTDPVEDEQPSSNKLTELELLSRLRRRTINVDKPASEFVYQSTTSGSPIFYRTARDGVSWEWSPDSINWMPTGTVTVVGGVYDSREPSEENRRLIRILERRRPRLAGRTPVRGGHQEVAPRSAVSSTPLASAEFSSERGEFSAVPTSATQHSHAVQLGDVAESERGRASNTWRIAQGAGLILSILILALDRRDMTILFGLLSAGTLVLCIPLLRPRKLLLPVGLPHFF